MDKTSVIIPTYNRPDSLLKTLKTLFKQSVKINEIIILDDSTNDETRKIIKSLNKKVIYIRKDVRERGTSRSRNIGLDKAKGDFIFFLDDDITVSPDYVEASLKFFNKNKQANAIQWYAYSDHDYKYNYNKIKNILMRALFLGYYSKDESLVTRSMAQVIPHPLTKNIETQYMGAGTSVIRKKCKDIRFDEKLTGYALQEDLDWSYRIYKKYGGLYLLKDRKLHHAYSLTARDNLRKIMRTKFIYLTYIFRKNIEQTPLNIIAFWIAMISRILLRVPNILLKPSKANSEELKYSVGAIFSALAHFSSIQRNPNYFKESA